VTNPTTDPIEAAARYLFAARSSTQLCDRMPEALRPTDIESALAIQRRVGKLLGLAVGGWKCSVPSAERKIAAAPIFASTIFRASPCPVVPVGGQARIEPEIAFVIGSDLPARAAPYNDSEVRDAIRETRAVLEILGSRYSDPSRLTFPELLADHLANQGLLVGPMVAEALNRPVDAFFIRVTAGGKTIVAGEGKHPDGHPLRPLVWLVNHLAAHETGLSAGQIVTTGSYCGAIDVPLDSDIDISWGDFAQLRVRFVGGN
jgi:2-keto-4-pentenoate hydratase